MFRFEIRENTFNCSGFNDTSLLDCRELYIILTSCFTRACSLLLGILLAFYIYILYYIIELHADLYVLCQKWRIKDVQSYAHQGLYSLSYKTSYRQISWSLWATRFDVIIIVSIWNLRSHWSRFVEKILETYQERTWPRYLLSTNQILYSDELNK